MFDVRGGKALVSLGQAGAFADCANLIVISIPASVTHIAEDAFAGCSDLRISGMPGTCAETFALKYGIPFIPVGSAG